MIGASTRGSGCVSKPDKHEWDEWLEMSDAEQEAVLAAEMRAYESYLDQMPLDQRIRHHTRNCLETCAKWRKLLVENDFSFAREHLKQCQLRLLKLRIWRQTGNYPGSA